MATQERMITVAELTLMKERHESLLDALTRIKMMVAVRDTSTPEHDTLRFKTIGDTARAALDAVREMEP